MNDDVPIFARTDARAVVYLLLAALSGCFLYLAWDVRHRRALLREEGVKAGGRVVAMKSSFWQRNRRTLTGDRNRFHRMPHPVVEFTDEEGNARRAEALDSNVGLIVQPVGRRVTVLYAKSNPRIAEVWAIHNDAAIPSRATRVYVLNPYPDHNIHIALFFTLLFGAMGLYSLGGPIHRVLSRGRSGSGRQMP